jgi:LacI family transcriptional regulator
MAVGLMSALRVAGVRMPEEMAVTGFDDIEIAQYLNPPLTTVHVDTYELGERAFQKWIQTARDGDSASPRHEVLPTRLVIRQSCGSNGKA